ncbi:hypothetical protein ACIBCN_41975 [Nocardia sp. NPDC051052]|uniref:hypothetical protein n=1 Tax=Nocardia sp. NPDC051052 TaxID=3364322 RepID=UPI003787F76B
MARMSKELAALAVLAVVIYCAGTDSLAFWKSDAGPETAGSDWFDADDDTEQLEHIGGFRW